MTFALPRRNCRILVKTPGNADDTTDILEINGGKSPELLRVRFRVMKSTSKEPNTGEVTVTNLSPSHRASLSIKHVRVQAEAGYVGSDMKRIFIGDARTVDSVRVGADWETTFKLGDGERAWKHAFISESWAPGTRAGDILQRLAELSELQIGNVSKKAPNIDRVFDQGYVAIGKASTCIDRLVKSLRLEWSIQDGSIYVLARGEKLDLPVPEVSPDSGLIGSPEAGSPTKKKGAGSIKFKCLLTPAIPGSHIRLKSERYDGEVRVERIVHDCDTFGNNWYSDIDATIVSGSQSVDVVSGA